VKNVRTSTETYEHTINGLLQKRKEIMEEMAVARERMGLMANDIEAIDRILARLGHEGILETALPAPRHIIFYRGQLRQWILTQLRERGPATSRQLAERLAAVQMRDKSDRRMMEDLTGRIGKALAHMKNARMVDSTKKETTSEHVWRMLDER
jgi:hypothetical protein